MTFVRFPAGGHRGEKAVSVAHRILYVEDNPANYRLVERMLRDQGYEVLHARDGFEGVRKAIEERDRLDLILLDINLPGMDGYETATKLKAIPGLDRIPVVAVTVNSMAHDRKRSLAAGCDGYIPKPIAPDTFPSQIRSYLRGKRDRIQPADERVYLREHARRLVDRLESSLTELQVTHERMRHGDKLATIGEMAAGFAHEINNPLASIAAAVEILLQKTGEADSARRHLEVIARNVSRLQRLASSLTSFARPSEAERALLSVGQAVEDAVVVTQYEVRKAGIELQVEVDPGLPPLWASPDHIQHALVNLIRNAAQAVREKLEAQPGAEAQVLVKATMENEHIVLSVTDTGTGIAPEYQDRLFTPFFTTKPKGRGTGLGLYIVKQIVDDLRGRIEVRTLPGHGSTFRLHLPPARQGGGRTAQGTP